MPRPPSQTSLRLALAAAALLLGAAATPSCTRADAPGGAPGGDDFGGDRPGQVGNDQDIDCTGLSPAECAERRSLQRRPDDLKR